MPVTRLFVEGELDAQLLAPLFAGRPVVQALKGSKHALAPRTLEERAKDKTDQARCYYLRDRDFDYEPPEEITTPVVDREHEGRILGWRWARHEIENYMLEPALVAQCLGVSRDDYVQALSEAAMRIRFYEAARWAIGLARARLPQPYRLQTHHPRRRAGAEFYLPDALDDQATARWLLDHVSQYRGAVDAALDADAVREAYRCHVRRFTDAFLANAHNVLAWFSGKDLMKALAPWLPAQGIDAPGAFRNKLRDWMRENPSSIVQMLPEWNELRRILRT